MQPSERYRADIDANLVEFDAAQAQVIEQFDRLHCDLIGYSTAKPSQLENFFRFFSKFSNPGDDAPKGLYVWGGVGRGKTYLMDLFFDCLETQRKRRTHFYRFMQEVHQSLAEHQGEADPLRLVAANIAEETEVLCFDEFFIVDIGDAMILAGLLEALFSSGVVLVATSNVEPDSLYENGLQRERFLPAIGLLKNQTAIVEMTAGTDYRLKHLSSSELFHTPIDGSVDQKLMQSFCDLVPDQAQIIENDVLVILDREIRFKACAEDVVWFDFSAICGGPRSAFDYVELAKLFHAVILSSVPQMTDAENDLARRFVSLIDELYDCRVKLIVSAECPVDSLYSGSKLEFEFQRTCSRLVEMQSHEYLSRGHRI